MANCVGFEDRRFLPKYDLEAPEAVEFADDLLVKVEAMIAEKTSEEWLNVFHEAGVPAMPVQFVEGLLDNEQAQANDLVVEHDHHAAGKMQLVGPNANFSDTPLEAARPSPALGEHTAEILAEAGYTTEEVAALLESGGALG
jgi:crotonobetainyl-CoA:carnitine CoA-transferase CaiB-like acyl-CoA transferase